MRKTFKQLVNEIKDAYDELDRLDEGLVNTHLALLDTARLTLPESKKNIELFVLSSVNLAEYFPHTENLLLVDVIAKQNDIASLIKEAIIEKEILDKDENNIRSATAQAMLKKIRETELEYIMFCIEKSKELEEYYRRQIEKREHEKEKEEQKRLIMIANQAHRELFNELSDSIRVTNISFSSGINIEIKHAEIFKLSSYKKLHEEYFTNLIDKDEYRVRREDIVFDFIKDSIHEHLNALPPEKQKLLSNLEVRKHAKRIDQEMVEEMQNTKHYATAIEARNDLSKLEDTNIISNDVKKLKCSNNDLYKQLDDIRSAPLTDLQKLSNATQKVSQIAQAIQSVEVQHKEDISAEAKPLQPSRGARRSM